MKSKTSNKEEKYWVDNVLKPAGKGCVAIFLAIVLVGVASFLAIKLCLMCPLSAPESTLLEGVMPLLEKMVWPLFFLILVFLFWTKIENSLEEIPELLERSTLPNSANVLKQENRTKENSLAEAGFQGGKSTSQDDASHEKIVQKIFEIIKSEDDVEISENIKIPASKWVCHGGFMLGKTPCYITVVQKANIERLTTIIDRVSEAIYFWSALRKKSSADVILMCCVYGFENQSQIQSVDVAGLRQRATYKLVFRFFTKEQLSDGVGEE